MRTARKASEAEITGTGTANSSGTVKSKRGGRPAGGLATSSVRETVNLFHYERDARSHGHEIVAGVDEAGRGPLAGPVVAACVVLPDDFDTVGVNDSKQLTEAKREAAYDRICREAIAIGVGVVDHETIDRVNILQATYVAMRLAISGLEPRTTPSIVLVDGNPVPGLPCEHVRSIVGGDALSISIAAASIIAKVTRDRFMMLMDSEYPAYGFAKHKGYSAPIHLEALRRHGPCPIHRRSFSRVAELCQPTLLQI